MAIAVVVRGDDPVTGRQWAMQLELAADDIEVVAVAATADEADCAVAELLPDVVLIDLAGPLDLASAEAHRLRAVSPSTLAVVVAGDDSDDALVEALCFGAAGVCLRDADVASTAAMVTAVAAGRLTFPPAVVGRLVQGVDRVAPRLLSDGERVVLDAAAEGRSTSEIAASLALEESTILRRVRDVLAKVQLVTTLSREAGRRDEEARSVV